MLLVAFNRPITDPDPDPITPGAGINGFCPSCGAKVHSRKHTRGNPSIPYYFVHNRDQGCTDSWKGSGGETEWHLQWKYDVQAVGALLEVPFESGGVRHRTDAVTPGCGTAIEFQRSPLKPEAIAERSAFYTTHARSGRLVWVFNAEEQVERVPKRDGMWRWRKPRTLPSRNDLIVFLDLGDGDLLWCHAIEPARTGRRSDMMIYGKTMQRAGFLKSVSGGFGHYRLTSIQPPAAVKVELEAGDECRRAPMPVIPVRPTGITGEKAPTTLTAVEQPSQVTLPRPVAPRAATVIPPPPVRVPMQQPVRLPEPQPRRLLHPLALLLILVVVLLAVTVIAARLLVFWT